MSVWSSHCPVLLGETLEGLRPRPAAIFVDCTFGRGGHAKAILDCLGSEGRLLALDRDPQAINSKEAAELRQDPRFSLEHGRFSRLHEFVARYGWVGKVSGVLMDLGVSSPQLDDAERGFSFLRNGPLDMRMDTSRETTAAEWLANTSESQLTWVLRELGEERYARRIAHAIVCARQAKPLLTTGDLVAIIERIVPRVQGKHPATRSFQAIRIFINQELDEVEQGLRQAVEVLGPAGRLAVISFHSLEDRIVKRFMRDEQRGEAMVAHRLPLSAPPARLSRIGKAIRPTPVEVLENPRARSAVLRVAERLASR